MSKALIKRDRGKVWGPQCPLLPSKTNQNEAKEEILGHPTGKIGEKRQRWSRGHKARGQVHKKIQCQDQGPTFRAETLSRPKTQSASVLQKKKDLQINFPGVLQKQKKFLR